MQYSNRVQNEPKVLKFNDCEKCVREYVPVQKYRGRWLCDVCMITEKREERGRKTKEIRDREDDFMREVSSRRR